MSNPAHHRRLKRLGRLLRPALAVLVTAPALALTAVVATNPGAAVAATDWLNILPPSELEANWSNVSGNTGDVPMPDCGSTNIAPQSNAGNNNSRWTVTSQIGSGSTVFVGQEWTVRAQIDAQVLFKGTFGNDGPDPLNLDLIPQGPVTNVGPPVADQVGPYGGPYTGGDGETGPVAARGAWGYEFDANSNPPLSLSGGDGADAIVTVTLKATAAGEIQMKRFKVTGHDGTPKAGPVNCELYLGWYWNVIEMQDPVATLDHAITDASYAPAVVGDRTTGRHGVTVDVLANDDDLNENFGCDGFCGIDPDRDIRIASWDASRLDCGAPALNGMVPTAANFNSLATGPCIFYPSVDTELFEEASYTMVQRSGLRTASSTVLVQIAGNQPPTINVAEDSVQAGEDFSEDLTPFHDDAEQSTVTCAAEPLVLDPATPGITAAIDAGCVLTWNDDGSSNYEGLITVSYRGCDIHTTLQGNARAAAYDRHVSDAALDDLSATTTRRCAEGSVEITRQLAPPVLAPAFTAVNDYDVIDRPYASDGILPFHLDMDVAANDASFAGADNVTVQLYGGQYIPAQAIVSVAGNRLQVQSTDGSPNKLTIGYRICGNFANLNGAQRCATAKAIITVRGNKEPVTADDFFGVTPKSPSIREVKANDTDPESEGDMTCSTTNHPATPGAFDDVDVSSACVISFDAADDFTGDATIEYNICDNHKLADPIWDRKVAPGYGTFGAVVGGPASRCAPALAHFTFKNFVLQLPPAVEVVPNLPTCVDDAFQVKADTLTSVNVLANDSDLTQDDQPGALTLPPPAEEQTTQGGLISSIADQIQYAPKAGFTGVDTANYNVLDSDGNGCSAVVTFTVVLDSDNDGVPNPVDPDVDGDGIPNGTDPDIDGDGIPNDQDPDMDGDGIPNGEDPDMDGDGILNGADPDNNSDGVPDVAPTEPTEPTMPGGGQLPATGSTTGPTTSLAIGSLLLGFGLLLVARRRRRTAVLG